MQGLYHEQKVLEKAQRTYLVCTTRLTGRAEGGVLGISNGKFKLPAKKCTEVRKPPQAKSIVTQFSRK